MEYKAKAIPAVYMKGIPSVAVLLIFVDMTIRREEISEPARS